MSGLRQHDGVTVAAPAARLATIADVDELVRLRSVMFEAMGVAWTDPLWESNAAAHFRRVLVSGAAAAAVIDEPSGAGGRLAACGVLAFEQRIPGPRSPGGLIGYISSMSTDPAWRSRGLGRLILQALIDAARARGASRIDLHATAVGQPLYESAGFQVHAGNPEMHLLLTDSGMT